ncbi:MAG: Ribonuclease P protein component [Parcubacteria group bacterium GW2011_GWA2_44_12]|nr:MAG: Ribonuclease P protein component [Parcubacteria group bacterium GW2011_GWA2_44_12]
MLPSNHRLRKRKDFSALLQSGRSFSTQEFSLRVIRNGLSETRIAVSVSKKFSKKAVERNTARRRVREIFRLHLGRIQSGFDILFVARLPLKGMHYRDIEALLLAALKTTRLI